MKNISFVAECLGQLFLINYIMSSKFEKIPINIMLCLRVLVLVNNYISMAGIAILPFLTSEMLEQKKFPFHNNGFRTKHILQKHILISDTSVHYIQI